MTPARTLLAFSLLAVTACAAPSRPVASSVPAATALDVDAALVLARDAFHANTALDIVRTADRGYRVRGNAAYAATLDAVEAALVAGGYARATSLTRESLGEQGPGWNARRASLEMLEPERATLLAFDASDDTNRTMLVAYSPGGDVTGEVVDVGDGHDRSRFRSGAIVLTDAEATSVIDLANARGALAVLSAATSEVNAPARYPDTVRYDTLGSPGAARVPVIDLSPAVAARLRADLARGKVRVRLRAEVSTEPARAETLVARVDGSDASAPPIVVVAHADEPGANDNASGVGCVTAVALAYRALVERHAVPPPARSVVFLVGTEIESSTHWLAMHRASAPLFGLAVDMVGEAPETAPMLIERSPDPGAVRVRPPDAHTAWFHPDGPVRSAPGTFLDAYTVSLFARVAPQWTVRDHPFEGGSDHVPFLDVGAPAVLLWHFPDDAYHTNRDRLARVSADEIAREGAGILALVVHAAQGSAASAVEVLALTERYSRARLARESENARAAVASPPPGAARNAAIAIERAHLTDWARWLDDSLASCASIPVGPAPALGAAIEHARGALQSDLARALASLPAS